MHCTMQSDEGIWLQIFQLSSSFPRQGWVRAGTRLALLSYLRGAFLHTDAEIFRRGGC